MDTQFELLEAEVLKLPLDERATLAQLLLASLDEDNEIDDAWDIETQKRIADIENGTVQVVEISDALAQVHTSLK